VSDYPFSTRRRPRPRPRRRGKVIRAVAAVLVLVAVFLVGIALGKALDDGPKRGGTETVVRTLEPLPQKPEP